MHAKSSAPPARTVDKPRLMVQLGPNLLWTESIRKELPNITNSTISGTDEVNCNINNTSNINISSIITRSTF
jgi:hypothetical protein